MLRRVLLIVLFSTLLAIVGYWMRHPVPRQPEQSVDASIPISAVLERRHFDPALLPPDRRFRLAVADVARALGAGRDSVTCAFEGGRWSVRLGAHEVGTVSAYPTFAELRGTLVRWAAALGARDTLRTPRIAGADRAWAAVAREADALHALIAADRADRAWREGGRDARGAVLGARALAWLAVECLDGVGAADAVGGRALAWNAIAAALDSTAIERETVLLAGALGYHAEAWERSAALARTDPIRLYARREDEALAAWASGSNGTRETRWLAMLRGVERGDLEGWAVAADRGLDGDRDLAVPLLAGALALGRFESAGAAAAGMLAAVTVELGLGDVVAQSPHADAGPVLGRFMDLFESVLAAIPVEADGAFLDRAVVESWYRSAFYSALYRAGEHVRRALSDTDGTLALARELGEATGTPGPAEEFRGWFQNLARLKAHGESGAALKSDLIRTRTFGGTLALTTYEAMREASGGDPQAMRKSARFLQRQLDGRPAHLRSWGWIAWDDLGEVLASEPMRAAASRASHPLDCETRAEWMAYTGDRAGLDRLLAARVADPLEIVVTLENLRLSAPGESLRIDEHYERLLEERPGEWQVLYPYLHSLAARHRSERVRELAVEWLQRPDRTTRAFEEVFVRNVYARACLDGDRVREGYAALAPVLGSGQEDVLLTGAELLDRAGGGAEAETLAMSSWRRYPDSPASQVAVVDLLWRHGRHDEAASVLRNAPVPLGGRGWRHRLGPRFVRLERENHAEAMRAVGAMMRRGLDDWARLGSIGAALYDAGRHEAAAAVFDSTRREKGTESSAGDVYQLMFAYHNVKAGRGTEAAGRWLVEHLPGRDDRTLDLTHTVAYGEGNPEVLWVLPMSPEEDAREFGWLLRAAAMVRDSAGTPEQRAAVEAWFARPAHSRYRHLGRMLLGLEREADILALPGETRATSEACYYLGIAAQARGDYPAAAAWYSRCIDQNVWSNGEHNWALEQLARWVGRRASLARLAAEDGYAPAGPSRTPVREITAVSTGAR